jgi:tetratricopeptide (TPR) repeat protein
MALSNLATSMATSQGDYSIALQYYEQAYLLACELGNGKGQAITLSNMGWVNGILGNYPVAVNYLHQALTVMRRIEERPRGINTHLNFSAIAGGQGDARNALDWAEKALAIALELGDRTGSAWAYFYLGYAHLLGGQFNEAVQSFLRSIEIRSEISVPVLVVEARAGLVDVYLKMGDQPSAQTEMEQILEYMDMDKTFEGAEEPLRIFLEIHRVFLKTKDPRAPIILQNAIQLLNTQVSKLSSEEARHMFVNNVPWRRALYQAAKENGLAD